MSDDPSRRLLVLINAETMGDPGAVVTRLSEAGFETLEVLETLGVAIGRFSGDPAVLRQIPGVQVVREEGPIDLSPPTPYADPD